MWGYGWLMILTENPLAQLIFQNVLAIFSVGYLIRNLRSIDSFDSDSLLFFKILLILSVPWFAFHSLRWPNSIANSLFILSFTLCLGYFKQKENQIQKIVLSGILFGLALNFRSDYYLMPLGWTVILFVLSTNRLKTAKSLGIWLFSTYMMLVPWSLYSKRATDHFRLTSTNGGAVLFIGLGALPGNKWGITPVDGDPKMHQLLKERFGPEVSFVSQESDQFLKSTFLEYILKDPLEYSKKVLYVFKRVVTGGMYSGEFYENPECQPNCWSENRARFQNIISKPLNFFQMDRGQRASTGFLMYSIIVARMVIFFSFITLPFIAIKGILERNLFLILLHASILYFSLVISLSNYLSSYTCNMYILHGLNLMVVFQWAKQHLHKPIHSSQPAID
jgi:4-amino-4-deoxy-L-arabinose transferase-like glycosyltransferase